MNEQFWWYLSRASGIVAWGFLMASVVWGVLLSTRLLKPYDRPAWLLDLHSWLGTLTIFGTALHVAAIVADSYVHFGVADVLVPFASSWKPGAVAWGVIGMYLLVVVQVSSWLRRRISKAMWRTLHTLSYALFVTVTAHALTAGTDRVNRLFQAFVVAMLTVMVVTVAVRLTYTREPTTRRVLPEGVAAARSKASSDDLVDTPQR